MSPNNCCFEDEDLEKRIDCMKLHLLKHETAFTQTTIALHKVGSYTNSKSSTPALWRTMFAIKSKSN